MKKALKRIFGLGIVGVVVAAFLFGLAVFAVPDGGSGILPGQKEEIVAHAGTDYVNNYPSFTITETNVNSYPSKSFTYSGKSVDSGRQRDYKVVDKKVTEASATATIKITFSGDVLTAINNGRITAKITIKGKYHANAHTADSGYTATSWFHITAVSGFGTDNTQLVSKNGTKVTDGKGTEVDYNESFTKSVTNGTIQLEVKSYGQATTNSLSKYAESWAKVSVTDIAIGLTFSKPTATFSAGTGGSVGTYTKELDFYGTTSATAKADAGYYFTKWDSGTTDLTKETAQGYTFAKDTNFSDKANFKSISTVGKTVTYSGARQTVANPTSLPDGFNYKITYKGTTNADDSYNSTLGPTEAGDYTATVEVYNGATTVSGNKRGEKTVTLKINPAKPKLSEISATKLTYGQTLSESTLTVKYVNPEDNTKEVAGKEPNKVVWTNPNDIPTKVPAYTAYYKFYPQDTANYEESVTGSVVIEVDPKVAELEWHVDNWYYYNGKFQSPTATVTNLVVRGSESDTCEVELSGQERDFTTKGEVRAVGLTNENYTLDTIPDKELVRYFSITKINMPTRELQINRADWTWDYDGKTYTVTVNADLLYGDVATVTFYVDDEVTENLGFKDVKRNAKNEVDAYSVRATLTHLNYETLQIPARSVQINRATMTGFGFDDIVKTYDGQSVSPVLKNDNEKGGLYTQYGDEVTAVYAIDNDVNITSVSQVKIDRVAGSIQNNYVVSYNTKVTLTNPNYVTNTMTAIITINKRPVTLTYENLTVEYGDTPELVPVIDNLVEGETLVFSCQLQDPSYYNTEGSPYTIYPMAQLQDNLNYLVTTSPCTMTVIPREITVKTVDFETVYGDVPDEDAYSYTTYKTGNPDGVGVLDGDSIYVEPVYNGWRAYTVNGNNQIKYQLVKENKNYNITFAAGTLNVKPRPVTVKAVDAEIVYGDPLDTSKYTAWRTVGEGAGVMEGDELVLSGESESLYEVVWENGEYGSHAYKFSAVAGKNPNYELTFESGYITVKHRPVTVTVKGATAKYGKPIPAFEITYTNLAPGESVSDVTTPATAVCDAVQFSDVGGYTISLTQASANNYVFDCTSEAILTIEAVEVATLSYDSDAPKYNGRPYEFSDTRLTLAGLAGGSKPTGSVSVAYRSGENEFSADAPTNAGEYDVQLTYTPANEGDNYALTVAVIEKGLIIQKITPVLLIQETSVDYTASAAKGMTVEFEVGEDCNAPQNEGSVSFEYYYGNAWQSTAPVNVGDYEVKATYTPVATGNYNAVTETATALHIKAVNVLISLIKKEVEYCAKEFKANVATVEGVGQDKVSQEVSYTYSATPLTVGEYDVTVRWTSNNDNYNTTEYFLEGAVKVIQNKTDLAFQIMKPFEKDYDGISIGSSVIDAQINVPNGWELPTGTIAYKLSRNGTVVEAPKDAGVYTVVATYTPGKNDQYAAKTMTYSEGTVTIHPVDVNFIWSKQTFVYNGKTQSANVDFTGVEGGSDPAGTLLVMYKQKDGTYSTEAPKNAGNYSLSLTYIPNPNKQDNYKKTYPSIYLSDVFVIEKATATISLGFVASDFTGNAVPYPREKIVVSGIAGDETPTGRVDVRYLYDGAWQSIPPYRSGVYDVRVLYYVEDEDGVEGNYAGADIVKPGGLTIYNIAPTIQLESKTVLYTGEAIAADTPRINTDQYDGTLSVEYLIGTSWSTSAPTDAGNYDVRVTYRAAENDSYRSAAKVFSKALVIQKVELFVVPFAGQFKEYDGNPHGFIGYTLKNTEGKDIGLLDEGIISGALTVGSNPNAGRYPIAIGDLSAGRNYVLTMAEETEYYCIEQKTVVVNYGEINPMYDGTEKAVEASINGLLEGDSVALQIIYEGDRKNVGTFKARAIMESHNYVLTGGEKEFTIAPALITGISMQDVVATYDGQPHGVVPTGTEGCDLTYETATSYTEVGGYVVRVRVEKPNHVTRTVEATVTILKGRQTVNVKAPEGKLEYGDALPKLDAGPDGVATLDQGQELKPGTFTYSYTYIPNDAKHYETQKGFIELTVEKRTPNLGVEGSLVQWAQNPNKLNGTVDIPMENVEIYYESEDGSRFTQMPTEEGKYRVIVSYKGNDLYAAGEYVTTLVIQKPVNYNWILIAGGVLIALALLAVVVVAVKRANEAK